MTRDDLRIYESADGDPVDPALLARLRQTAVAAGERFFADWDESQHPRDDHGEFSAGGTGLAAVLEKASQPDGGFTYQPVTGDQPREGFVVSVYKGREAVYDVKTLTLDDLWAYAKANWDLLQQPGNYFGGWHNPDDGKLYLDVSKVVHDRAEAERIGRDAHQLAIFDLKEGRSYPLAERYTTRYGHEAGAVSHGPASGRPDPRGSRGTVSEADGSGPVAGAAGEAPRGAPRAHDQTPHRLADWDESQHPRADDGKFSADGGADGVSEISPERKLDIVQVWMEGHEGQTPELYDKMRDPATVEGKEFRQVAETFPEYHGVMYRGLAVTQQEFDALQTNPTLVFDKHSSATTNKDVAGGFVGGGSGIEAEELRVPVLLRLEGAGRDFSEPHADYPETEIVILAGQRFTRVGEPKKVQVGEYPEPVFQLNFKAADKVALADWVEDLHPRATDGKFATAGATGGEHQTAAATAAGQLGHGIKMVKFADLPKDVRAEARIEGDAPLNPDVAAGINAAMDTLKTTSPKIYDFVKANVPFASVSYEPVWAAMTTVSGPSALFMLVNNKSSILAGKGFDEHGWTVAGTATAKEGTTGSARLTSLYRGMLFHEVGHVVDTATSRGLSRDLIEMVKKKFDGPDQAIKWLKENISGYAAHSPGDAVAESMSKVLLGQPLPSELKFIEDYVHGK